MVSQVNAGLLPLFTMSPAFGSGPRCKPQHGWIWFHSLSQSKRTQTASPAESAWGYQGRRVGFVLPWMLHSASPGLGGVLQAAPATFPNSAQALAAPCIPLVGEASPSLPIAGGLRAPVPLAQR